MSAKLVVVRVDVHPTGGDREWRWQELAAELFGVCRIKAHSVPAVAAVVLTNDQDVLAVCKERSRLVLDPIEETDLVTLEFGAGHVSLQREYRIAGWGEGAFFEVPVDVSVRVPGDVPEQGSAKHFGVGL